MNHCAVQQNSFPRREEMRRRSSISISISERSEAVFCPKPRRVSLLNPTFPDYHPVRPLRWHLGQQVELCESTGGSSDVLDMILTKGGCGSDQVFAQAASTSPPFFCGSPPSRVSNPLTQDAEFRNGVTTSSQLLPSIQPPSPSSATRKGGGCVRGNFGDSPAVRIEGFDCLDRDRRNCSIPALA